MCPYHRQTMASTRDTTSGGRVLTASLATDYRKWRPIFPALCKISPSVCGLGGPPQLEPRPPAWAVELDHRTQRLLVRLLVSKQGARVPPTARGGHILERQILPFRCPGTSEHVPKPSLGLVDLPALERFLEPVRCQVSRHRPTAMSPALRVRKE